MMRTAMKLLSWGALRAGVVLPNTNATNDVDGLAGGSAQKIYLNSKSSSESLQTRETCTSSSSTILESIMAQHACDPECPHLREDEMDFGKSLFQQIDLDNIVAHNESVHGACRRVFKPYAERLTADPHADSDSDAELLIHIPFCSSVTLKSFVVCGGSPACAPASCRLWVYEV